VAAVSVTGNESHGTQRADVTTVEHAILTSLQIPLLVRKLEACLPCSLPLLRRIQFSPRLHQPVSATARIFLAACREKAQGGDGDDDTTATWHPDSWLSDLTCPVDDARPWLAAYIDLAPAGQTQVWLFGSWEASPAYPLPSSLSPLANLALTESSEQFPQMHKMLLQSLFAYISRDLVPLRPEQPPDEWLMLEREGKYLSKPYSKFKVLFGTVGEKLWGGFDRASLTRTDAGYHKFVFRIPYSPKNEDKEIDEADTDSAIAAQNLGNGQHAASLASMDTTIGLVPQPFLPADYSFGAMQDSYLQTVLDRTPIPRTLATLRELVSLGIFHTSSSTPVGWGFLGRDASLSSLHTEPEHRGKGLAVALGAELLRRGSTKEEKDRAGGWFWGHADVSKHNEASLRVMDKLGGKPKWMVRWNECDIRVLISSG
jgi:GNAT superfamily N-acetyltransferase